MSVLAAAAQGMIAMMNASECNLEKFKYMQSLNLPAVEPQDLSGKNVIVTGANAGLGFEVAKSLATMKPQTLILACRNIDKAKTAAESIKSATGFSQIEIEELDLASFASTLEFTKRILAKNIAIDVLISNAGLAGFGEWIVTQDGYEIMLQVNHLANVLMVLSLVPALRKAKHPRVEIVASGNHFWPALPEPNDPHPIATLNQKSEKSSQYSSTKLLNIVFAKEFARRFPDIFICSSNPGFCKSELGTKNLETGGGVRDKTNLFADHGVQMRESSEGAKTLVHAAISPKANESGAYYSEMEAQTPRSTTLGEIGKKFGENVWSDTMEVLHKIVGKDSLPQQ